MTSKPGAKQNRKVPDRRDPDPPAKTARALVIDDKASMLELFRSLLEDEFDLVTAESAQEGLRLATEGDFDLVVTDIKMPHVGGMEILQAVKTHSPHTEVIVMTAYAEVAQAVEAMRAGAYDYITKPFDPDEMVLLVRRAVERKRLLEQTHRLQRQVEEKFAFENLIGNSPPMHKVYGLVRDVCRSDATVLISGESGTGKELVARAIHFNSPRAKHPFLAINCAAIPRELLESELFGHVKGAFSGAQADRRGLVEEAHGGTLFLDEISEMATDLQGKITRMIQEREIRPVGDTKTRRVSVRILAATNVDMEAAVTAGRFREDLYYRLLVYPIQIPPLRERHEDIPLLANHFLKIFSAREGKTLDGFAPEALAALSRAAWPGNVRELQNVIERAVLLARGKEITLQSLPETLAEGPEVGSVEIDIRIPYKQLVQQHTDAIGRQYLEKLFKQYKGNVSQAAEQAGVERETLHRMAKRLSIDPRTFRSE